MPWPDFSELSFGFAFLRELERNSTAGKFPLAPDFISQNEEAKKGYDVAVLSGSTPIFLQFKRSYVLKTARAAEIQNGEFNSLPLFRMHLRKKDRYRQHIALQELEQAGQVVLYVTSQIASFEELTLAYTNNTVLDDAAAMFAPSEIALPNRYKPHHLCFEANGTFAKIFSQEGKRFHRKFPSVRTIVTEYLPSLGRSESENRKALTEVATRLSQLSSPAREIANRFEDPVVKASVLAFLVLDAQLAFFKSA